MDQPGKRWAEHLVGSGQTPCAFGSVWLQWLDGEVVDDHPQDLAEEDVAGREMGADQEVDCFFRRNGLFALGSTSASLASARMCR